MKLSTKTLELLQKYSEAVEKVALQYRNEIITTYPPEQLYYHLPIKYTTDRPTEPILPYVMQLGGGQAYWKVPLIGSYVPHPNTYSPNGYKTIAPSLRSQVLDSLLEDVSSLISAIPDFSPAISVLKSLEFHIDSMLHNYISLMVHLGESQRDRAFALSADQLDTSIDPARRASYVSCFLYNFSFESLDVQSLPLSDTIEIRQTTYEDVVRCRSFSSMAESYEGDYLPPPYILTVRLPDMLATTYLQSWGWGGDVLEVDNVITALRLLQKEYIGRGVINNWTVGIQTGLGYNSWAIDSNIARIADRNYDLPRYVLHEEDDEQLVRLFNGIHNTPTGKQLGIALDRFNASYRWKQGFQDQERIIDIVIALENIFGKDVLKQTTEIGYRLRMQAARYLGENVDERKVLQKFFSKLYGLRSKIVHGDAGNVADIVQKDFKKPLSEVVAEAEKYLRKALVKLLLNPDHMKQDYFNNLLLGEE